MGALVAGAVLGAAVGTTQEAQAAYSTWSWTGSMYPTWCARDRASIDYNGAIGLVESRTYTNNCSGGSPYSRPISHLAAAVYITPQGSSAICSSGSLSYSSTVSASWSRFAGACTGAGLMRSYGYTAWYWVSYGYQYHTTTNAGPVYQ